MNCKLPTVQEALNPPQLALNSVRGMLNLHAIVGALALSVAGSTIVQKFKSPVDI
jgi:hypothetical protein